VKNHVWRPLYLVLGVIALFLLIRHFLMPRLTIRRTVAATPFVLFWLINKIVPSLKVAEK